MEKQEKFFVTTPIYYTNAPGHIGHAYTTVAADVLARFNRAKGLDVFFLTGTDEHGAKVAEAAEKAGKSPKEFVDEIVDSFKKIWQKLNIEYDYFVRTTDERHEKAVFKYLNELFATGDIYLGKYEGLYCQGCEKFLLERELVKGKCPLHLTAPKKLKEDNYFFRLSKYKEQLIKVIENDEFKIEPVERKNEVLSFLKTEELKDTAISRPTVQWAIKLPWDEKQYCYVWIEALLNYVSSIGYEDNPKQFKKYWPADVQLIAKDILRFHAVIWPAMLMALHLKLPQKLFVHGYFTVNGQKMSKSLGNVIDPVWLAEKYGVDAVRYFLLREVPFGSDGDISIKGLEERINSELADSLGNLLNRVVVMIAKYFKNEIPVPEKKEFSLEKTALSAAEKVDKHFTALEFHKALIEVMKLSDECNKFINERQPWVLAKQGKTAELGTTLYQLTECLRIISLLLNPVMPASTQEIRKQLGLKKAIKFENALKFALIPKGTKIKKGRILFQKIEAEKK